MDDSSQRIIQFPHMLLLKLHFRNKKVESTPRYPKVFGKPQISSDLGLWRDPIAGILERLGSNGGVRLVVAGFSKRKMMVLRRFHQPKIWIYQDSYGFIKKRWKISENPIWTRKKSPNQSTDMGISSFMGISMQVFATISPNRARCFIRQLQENLVTLVRYHMFPH